MNSQSIYVVTVWQEIWEMSLLPSKTSKILVILCSYGLFKEIRPSEPFLTEYLVDARWGNLPKEDVYSKVYPVWSYAYFFLLIPVFVLTDFLRYKPVLCIEGLSYMVTWILLLWVHGMPAMQGMQAVYGVATSTEVAYYTYIYSQVPTLFSLNDQSILK